MNVYRLMFMRNKLYGLEDNGSFRIEPDDEVTETKYDSIMRNVVLNLKPKLGIAFEIIPEIEKNWKSRKISKTPNLQKKSSFQKLSKTFFKYIKSQKNKNILKN